VQAPVAQSQTETLNLGLWVSWLCTAFWRWGQRCPVPVFSWCPSKCLAKCSVGRHHLVPGSWAPPLPGIVVELGM
jgi:hypothetical protein